jgi:hypothetical protein
VKFVSHNNRVGGGGVINLTYQDMQVTIEQQWKNRDSCKYSIFCLVIVKITFMFIRIDQVIRFMATIHETAYVKT